MESPEIIAERVRGWTSQITWDENDTRTDANLNFKVKGITGGNTLSLMNAICINSKKEITEDVMKKAIHLIAETLFRDTCQIWNYGWKWVEFENDNWEKDLMIECFAYVHLSDGDDEIDEGSGLYEE